MGGDGREIRARDGCTCGCDRGQGDRPVSAWFLSESCCFPVTYVDSSTEFRGSAAERQARSVPKGLWVVLWIRRTSDSGRMDGIAGSGRFG